MFRIFRIFPHQFPPADEGSARIEPTSDYLAHAMKWEAGSGPLRTVFGHRRAGALRMARGVVRLGFSLENHQGVVAMRWIFTPAVLVALAATAWAQPKEPPTPPAGVPEPTAPYGPPSLAREYKELIPSLIDALKDTDPEVRQHTAMALAALGREALAALTKALEDPVKEKRAAAAYALGQMGYNAHDAVPALLKALKDDEAVVRRSASQAINRVLSGEMFVTGRGVPGMHGIMPGASGSFGPGGAAPQLPRIEPGRPGAFPLQPPPDAKPRQVDKPDKP
jgi:hypothetical protein